MSIYAFEEGNNWHISVDFIMGDVPVQTPSLKATWVINCLAVKKSLIDYNILPIEFDMNGKNNSSLNAPPF